MYPPALSLADSTFMPQSSSGRLCADCPSFSIGFGASTEKEGCCVSAGSPPDLAQPQAKTINPEKNTANELFEFILLVPFKYGWRQIVE
ncbi:MAG: hypothetical protein ACYS0H_11375 [Planctomycetota bacterium]